ncbi:glycine-rich protein 2-like [Ostrinia furnacalis]|uniref:glycine-rich protein 2-like n=1 Tax=Ostrinia furnacalis TaxID=93504 RepID=UPI00103DA310|nr:glycine-rich protein 2-like [Ostrinia furnacalis]
MGITINITLFLVLFLLQNSWSLEDKGKGEISASSQNERSHLEPDTAPLSRVKRQYGYGYGPYYGGYRRPYPLPIIFGGGIVVGGYGGRGFGGPGFGGGFGGRGFGGRGFGGRGFGGGFGGRGFGGFGGRGVGGFGGGRGGGRG